MILKNVTVTFDLFQRTELERGHFEDNVLKSLTTKVRWDDNVDQYYANFERQPKDDRTLRQAWISTSSKSARDWIENYDRDLVKITRGNRTYRIKDSRAYSFFKRSVEILIEEHANQ